MRFGFLLRLVLAVVLAFGLSACTTCANVPIQIADAPPGNFRAIAFERVCGNQSKPGLQVSLFDSADPPQPEAPGNVFISLTGSYVNLRWTEDSRLLVVSDAPAAKIVKQQPTYAGIRINYRYPTFQEFQENQEREST
ncbi:MAG: hypothetical protein AAFY11_12890 [Cyanobacteria bacterium J06641_5]